MGAVRKIIPTERVHIDGAFLVEVSMQLGPVAAKELLDEALGTLALELRIIAGVVDLMQAGATDVGPDLGEVVAICDRLSRMAWELGLTTLSSVAVDLGLCAEAGDIIQFRAVEARLQRVGRKSLCAALEEAASC